ncbi:hypothetical protein D1B33_04745 [Lysinibacillus yapensis]|uniref:Uncharacterized protein n=1 Tax=Ureibacillus yapensis TaxID=2304605 RepID=A0A396SAZ9_9BACL|nr:hypothetical protein [Lysinibacillus yapensis]RHW38200.1 hypothetical protein D1B33_04745 [Lysinibacillus yapensis]
MKKFNWVLFILPILLFISTYFIRINKVDANIFHFDLFIFGLFLAVPAIIVLVIYCLLLRNGIKRENMKIVNSIHIVFLGIACILFVKTILLPTSNVDLILKQGNGEENFAKILFERVEAFNVSEDFDLTLRDYTFITEETSGAFMDSDSTLLAQLTIKIDYDEKEDRIVEMNLECIQFDSCFKRKGELNFK